MSTIARRDVIVRDVREAAKVAILRLTDDAIRNEFVRGMSAEREEFVSYLAATPEAIEALIEAPFSLLREAERRLAAWDELGRFSGRRVGQEHPSMRYTLDGWSCPNPVSAQKADFRGAASRSARTRWPFTRMTAMPASARRCATGNQLMPVGSIRA
jgi:hypothetical protein